MKKVQEIKHSDTYMQFTVVVAEGVDPNEFAGMTERFFNNYFRKSKYFGITAFSMASMVEQMESLMGSITTAISVIAGIALLVGALKG